MELFSGRHRGTAENIFCFLVVDPRELTHSPLFPSRAYLTYCANEKTYGLYSGIFFTLFIANQVLGNVSAAVLLDQNIETSFVFKILAGVAIIGLIIFAFLRPASRPVTKADEEDAPPPKSSKPKILEVMLFMTQRKAALLAPLLIYSGLTQSFFFGSLPLFVNEPPVDMNELSIKLVCRPPSVYPFFAPDLRYSSI